MQMPAKAGKGKSGRGDTLIGLEIDELAQLGGSLNIDDEEIDAALLERGETTESAIWHQKTNLEAERWGKQKEYQEANLASFASHQAMPVPRDTPVNSPTEDENMQPRETEAAIPLHKDDDSNAESTSENPFEGLDEEEIERRRALSDARAAAAEEIAAGIRARISLETENKRKAEQLERDQAKAARLAEKSKSQS